MGRKPESAIFDLTTRTEYLTAGQRTLKGVLRFALTGPSHKLVLAEGASVSLESVGRLMEKTEDAATAELGKDDSTRARDTGAAGWFEAQRPASPAAPSP